LQCYTNAKPLNPPAVFGYDCASGVDVSLKIAIVSDIHAGSDNEFVKGTLSFELLEEALSHLVSQHPDILVDLGDRTNDDHVYDLVKHLEKLNQLFSKMPAPRHHLLGNHDFLHPAMQQKYLGRTFENHAVQLDGWQLIFLSAFDGSVNGTLTTSDLSWLEQTLATTTLPAVVFTHQPLDGQPVTGNLLFEAFPHWLHSQNHERARAILEASKKVHLVISGHGHWTHLENVNGINYLTLDSFVPSAKTGDALGFYSLLELNATELCLRTFGRESLEFRFSINESQ
jgi:3',5'-cyclic-AMP phosphodiesterase